MAIQPMGLLALAWLSTRPAGRGKLSDLKKALAGFARLTDPGALEAGLEAADRGGLLARDGRALSLTAPGAEEARRLLPGARPQWRAVRAELVAQKLGLPAKVKRTADRLRAAAIAGKHGLPAGESLQKTVDALAWKVLGETSEKPLTRQAVLRVLLGRAIGDPVVRDSRAAVRILTDQAAGVHVGKPRDLEDAVLREWLNETPARTGNGLEGFARRVTAAARTAPSGWFGDNKVFISHVHRALGDPGVGLDEFKERLVAAHRAELLTLSRADLVEAMNPADVAASETRYLNATFHFVRLEEGRA